VVLVLLVLLVLVLLRSVPDTCSRHSASAKWGSMSPGPAEESVAIGGFRSSQRSPRLFEFTKPSFTTLTCPPRAVAAAPIAYRQVASLLVNGCFRPRFMGDTTSPSARGQPCLKLRV